MGSCYFSPYPGMPNPPPAVTPPPEYLEYSDSELGLQLPRGEPETPDSLPSTLNEKAQRIQIIIPQNKENRPKTRRHSSSSLSSSEQMFSARPREDIIAESAYLEQDLQGQCRKKLTVYREYASTEAELRTVQTPKQRRSLRKRLSALRSQYYRIENQEKALEAGLCALRIEMRNNCAWNLARIESCCPSPVWSPPRPDTPLDATSPEFVPRWGFFSDWRESGTLEKVDETGEESGNNDDGTRSDEGVDQGSDKSEPGTQASNMSGTDEGDQEPARRKSLDWETPSLKERRLSLPYIPAEWV